MNLVALREVRVRTCLRRQILSALYNNNNIPLGVLFTLVALRELRARACLCRQIMPAPYNINIMFSFRTSFITLGVTLLL